MSAFNIPSGHHQEPEKPYAQNSDKAASGQIFPRYVTGAIPTKKDQIIFFQVDIRNSELSSSKTYFEVPAGAFRTPLFRPSQKCDRARTQSLRKGRRAAMKWR
jgi:hypothetical protein